MRSFLIIFFLGTTALISTVGCRDQIGDNGETDDPDLPDISTDESDNKSTDSATNDTDSNIINDGLQGTPLTLLKADVLDISGQYSVWTTHSDDQGNLLLAGKIETVEADDNEQGGLQGKLFVTKYDVDGNHLWTKLFPFDNAWVRSITSDAQGNVIFAGEFEGLIHFGGETLETGYSKSAMYIAKLASDGTHVHSKMAFEEHSALAKNLAVQADGTILLGGTMRGVLHMDNQWMFGLSPRSLFILTFDSQLDVVDTWHQRGSEGFRQMGGMIVTPEGETIIAGSGYGPLNLGGPIVYEPSIEDADQNFFFVAKLDGEGQLRWQKRFPHDGRGRVLDVGVALDGDIYVTGSLDRWVNFGGGKIQNDFDFDDGFLLKLNSHGQPQWSRGIGSAGFDRVSSLFVDLVGNVTITGMYSGQVDFGGITMNSASTSYGDAFIAQYSEDGQLRWCSGFGSPETSTRGVYVESLSDGKVLHVGEFEGELNLGSVIVEGNSATAVSYIAQFSIEPAAREKLFPFATNPGDVEVSILTGEYIAHSLKEVRASCNYDPISEQEYALCLEGDLLPSLSPGHSVSSSAQQLCAVSSRPIVSNDAAVVLIDGEPTEWGSATGRIELSSDLSGMLVGTPRVEVVDSTYHLMGTMVHPVIRETDRGYEFDLTWSQSFPCDFNYETALKIVMDVQCDEEVKRVESYSIHTWCRIDDTCVQYGWLSGGQRCHEVAYIAVP